MVSRGDGVSSPELAGAAEVVGYLAIHPVFPVPVSLIYRQVPAPPSVRWNTDPTEADTTPSGVPVPHFSMGPDVVRNWNCPDFQNDVFELSEYVSHDPAGTVPLAGPCMTLAVAVVPVLCSSI